MAHVERALMRVAALLLAAALSMPGLCRAAGFEFAMATNVANARYGWRTVALEVYSGIVEKAECASIATNDWPAPPGWYGHRAKGIEYKDFMADELLPLYINNTITNASGVYDSSNMSDFVMWDAASACVEAGISTNYLDVMGWYQWYDTNSWQHMADVLNVCRWTKHSVTPSGTNTLNLGSDPYTLEHRAGGFSVAGPAAAWADLANNWNAGSGIDTNTCTVNFYAAAAMHSTTGFANNFASQRLAGWSFAAGIADNVSHRLHIFTQIIATTNTGTPLCDLLNASNVFNNVGTGYGLNSFRRVLQVNSGTVIVTNHREMTAPIFHTLVDSAPGHNPLEAIPLPYTDPILMRGFRAKWADTWFMFEWDANAASGMQYIFN